jgi:O-antigen/teichoic acid export membrane protein
MSVKQRILHALAANAFGQAVTVGTQLLLTPLFFAQWGAALYGEWLLLSALPAYLTMADLGIGSAAGNDMTMRAGANDRRGAQATYRGAFRVAAAVGLLTLLAGVALALGKFSFNTLPTPHIQPLEAALVVLALAANVALSFSVGVFGAGYRCAGLNATGIVIGNGGRLLEALAFAALLLLGHGPLALCGAMLVLKLMLIGFQMLHLRRVCPWLHEGDVSAEPGLVRRLLKPSLAFMAMPLAGALSLQGPIIVLGAALGGEAVALFAAMRTLSRIPMQLMNALNASVWPEMSRAFGAGDMALLRQLHRRSARITAALVAASCLGLGLLGETITHLWLGAQQTYQPSLLLWLVAIAGVSALWNASSIVLAATNQHGRMGVNMVLSSAVAIGLGSAFIGQLGQQGFLVILLTAEVAMLLTVLPQALQASGDSLAHFLLGRSPPH